ncbi:hypothetical protein Mal4_09800 [Maioricimonas rarisocia]|uniref:Sulfotransferase domain protein n=1 Tax=Maioricimonas rarisocia TaxID=2528026 RepID=A0A517Z2J2_9PLAN|nr:sulfotransferase [Maioricimonas rarisocia]QDU36692.1 hypothetical protein Mal4_09800 [Maioricimonas rarisocia]
MNNYLGTTMVENPVFVLGCGWRTGSTLLQRLLCSHPEIHIWGENHGMLHMLQQAAETVDGYEGVARKHLDAYQRSGTDAWIPMMNPAPECFESGLRALLDSYYGVPAVQFGKPRWGFKEVRYGADVAAFLQKLFPAARFLVIVRHPADCLASARATRTLFLKKGLLADVGGSDSFLRHWADLGRSFLHADAGAAMLRLRYEDIVSEPETALQLIGDFLDVNPDDLDRQVFEVRRRGWLGRDPRLTAEDRDALAQEWLWEVAGNFDYFPRCADSSLPNGQLQG